MFRTEDAGRLNELLAGAQLGSAAQVAAPQGAVESVPRTLCQSHLGLPQNLEPPHALRRSLSQFTSVATALVSIGRGVAARDPAKRPRRAGRAGPADLCALLGVRVGRSIRLSPQ